MDFHYLDWGQPDAPPVLMLHGMAQSAHTWDFSALALGDRYRLLALDQRGHGDSDWAPDGDYSLDAHLGDIGAFVEAMGLRDLVMVGLSMGGRNAFSFAALRPEIVKALVIVDIAPVSGRSGASAIRNFIERVDELDTFEEFVDRVKGYNPRRSRDADQGQPGPQPEAAAQRQVDVEVRQGAAVAVAPYARPRVRRAAVGLPGEGRVPYPRRPRRVQQGAHPGDRGGDGAAPAARRAGGGRRRGPPSAGRQPAGVHHGAGGIPGPLHIRGRGMGSRLHGNDDLGCVTARSC